MKGKKLVIKTLKPNAQQVDAVFANTTKDVEDALQSAAGEVEDILHGVTGQAGKALKLSLSGMNSQPDRLAQAATDKMAGALQSATGEVDIVIQKAADDIETQLKIAGDQIDHVFKDADKKNDAILNYAEVRADVKINQLKEENKMLRKAVQAAEAQNFIKGVGVN